MTDLRCAACGRELANAVAFCPYCGADRRPAVPRVEVAPAPAIGGLTAGGPEPNDPATAPAVAIPVAPPPPSPPPASPPPASPPKGTAPSASAPRVDPASARARGGKAGGCGLRLLIALMLAAAGLAWCAVRAPHPTGPAPVPGAVATTALHVSRRWRTVALPGDAPANARFAVSSEVALRVRASGRIYTLKPGQPLHLPEDLGDSIEVRAADYVTAQDAARAKTTLSTLRGG